MGSWLGWGTIEIVTPRTVVATHIGVGGDLQTGEEGTLL